MTQISSRALSEAAKFAATTLLSANSFVNGFPGIILTDPALKSFALKLRDRGVARPEHCRFDNADYLLFGHKCVSMKNIRLLGLFPMRRIENQVSEKRKILGLLAFVSLLVSVSLGLFVARA